MRRDAIDFHEVRPIHAAVHERLLEWAKWCRNNEAGMNVHPMFRQYRSKHDEQVAPAAKVDPLRAAALQKVFVGLPELNRWVLNWYYCKPYIPLNRVKRALAVTEPRLFDLVHDSRSMLKNRAA